MPSSFERLHIAVEARANEPLNDLSAVRHGQLMLPNTDNSPSFLSQSSIYSSVAFHVPLHLCVPKTAIRARSPVAFRTSMPETTIYKHAYSLGAKNEVGRTQHLLPTTPPRNTEPSKQPNQPKLSRAIAI